MKTELPFINLKEVISKHDSYAEALKEITSNNEFPQNGMELSQTMGDTSVLVPFIQKGVK